MTLSTSSVTWGIVAAFVTGGLNNIVHLLPAGWATLVSGVIALIALYFHQGQITAGNVAKSRG